MLTLKPISTSGPVPADFEAYLEQAAVTVEQDIAFDIAQADAGRPSLFVLKCPMPLPLQNATMFKHQWNNVWAEVGVKPAPHLIVLDRGIDLVGLNEGDMANLGYFKAKPDPEPIVAGDLAKAAYLASHRFASESEPVVPAWAAPEPTPRFKVGDLVAHYRDPYLARRVAKVGAATLTLDDGSSSHIEDFIHFVPPAPARRPELHPSVEFANMMEANSISEYAVLEAFDMTPRYWQQFSAGKVVIQPRHAQVMESLTGVDAEDWLAKQEAFNAP